MGESKAEKIRTFFLQKPLWAFITSQERARHTFITGMSGSGKSELLKFMTYADLIKDNMNHHIVLLDPNGDLAEQTVKMAIAADFPTEDIIYIDPILFTDATPCLNPLQIEDKSETNIDRMSQELSGVFQSIIKLEGNLSLQMQALIIPCLSTLLREGDSSFTDLQNFMSEEKQAPYIRLGQQSPLPTHRSFFASAFSETGYKPTKQSLYTKLQTLLNSPTFVNLSVGVPTIDLPEILNSKRAKLIVFNLSKGSIGSDVSEALGRFILATISTIGMQRSKISENQRMPVYAIVDEFQNYVGGNTIKEGLAELRKYKIAYTLACQYAGQLDTDTQKAVFNNSSIKIIGQQQDPTSIATLSKITGASTDEIKELAPRQFILKRGHAKYLPITVPNIAHKKHQSISKMEWEAFLAYQKEHYYKPLINDVSAAEKWERIKHHDDIPRPKAAPKFKNY